MSVSEAAVVATQEVQDRCVEIPNMHGVLDDVVGELVGGSIHRTALRSTTGHPHGETSRMVIPTVVLLRNTALAVNGATKFTAPNDQRVVEQATLLEVGDQPVARLIDVLALGRHATGGVGMVIPVVEIHLHEAHAPFDEPARQECGVGEGTGLASLIAVELISGVRLLGHRGQFGHAGLHAEGHFELLDTRVRLGIAHLAMGDFVEATEAIELRAAKRVRNARRVIDEENGITSAPEGHPGMFTGQVATRP